MQKIQELLDHGNHNEAVCDYLDFRKNEFSDWIITTAFYSALRFVSYKIFPFEVPKISGGKTKISSIDEYANYKESTGVNIRKHALLSDLVAEKCNAISEDYEWLLSMSMNARYTEYRHSPEIRNKARSLMKKIKAHCIK